MSNEKESDSRREGNVTTYRPDDDRLSGGRDGSVQSEARGEKGTEELGSTSTTSGGAAGKINDLDDTPDPER